MTRRTVILATDQLRETVARWARNSPPGTVVEFRQAKRSNEQNDLMWAALGDISKQVEWHGQMLEPDDWKLIFMNALNSEMRLVPALDGKGFVHIGTRSSKLSKQEMSDLIELIFEFGSRKGVRFLNERAA